MKKSRVFFLNILAIGMVFILQTIGMAAPYPYPANPIINSLPATIDIMVLYTQTAENNFRINNPISQGEQDRALTEIAEAVDYLNTALSNSDVNAAVNVVHSQCICTSDTQFLTTPPCGTCDPSATLNMGGNDGEALFNLSTPSSSVSNIHAWRDQYGADLVILIAHGGSVSGIANSPEQFSTAFDSEAFEIVFTGNEMGSNEDRTFAHEFGHLLGSLHDWYGDEGVHLSLWDEDDDEFNPSVDYNHGHVDVDETTSSGFYTIMSYPNLCLDDGNATCRAIPYFSNPDINDPVTLRPTGIADHQPDANYYSICLGSPSVEIDDAGCPADVASLFTHMAPYVEAYRSTNGPDGQVSNVTISQPSPLVLKVSWSDGSTNEKGFRIYRSQDSGLNWTYLTAVGPNITNYEDTINSAYRTTPPWNKWSYRVQAYNDDGMSTYNESSITINNGCNSVDIDFEDNPDLGLSPWSNDVSYPFAIAAQPGGNLVLQSFAPDGSGQGPAEVTISETVEDGFLCFDLTTGALLQVTVDGGLGPVGSAWSAEPITSNFAIPVTAGTHTFGWQLIFYSSEVYTSAEIDNIDFPLPGQANNGLPLGVLTLLLE